MIHFNIVTLFPEFFASPLSVALLGKAVAEGLVSVSFHNPRDFGKGIHRHVDDRPFGGGPGMVMQLEPVLKSIGAIAEPGKILLMSPAGRQLDQQLAEKLAREQSLTLVCGRYEGIDSRLGELVNLEELSLCPAVLNGGETAALALIEAVSRYIPGFLGKNESVLEESFSDYLLEYPQYTRPENYNGCQVPAAMLGGNHARIAEWRRHAALEKTLEQRPELLTRASLSGKDIDYLKSLPRTRRGRNISFCLCHAPVILEKGRHGASSLTNLDVHDIARISRSYGMGTFFVLHPCEDQRRLLDDILNHWLRIESGHEDRKSALAQVRAVSSFAEVEDACLEKYGQAPAWLLTSARAARADEPSISFEEARELSGRQPVLVCLGTARGLCLDELPVSCLRLPPIRYLDENHLSVRSAAAIVADRILGDYF